jgi:hypothetical protein
MITSVSALLDRKTRRAVLADLNRGRAVARFREEGLPVPDIALALNCSRPIIDYFLLRQKPWFRKNEEKLRTKRQARDLRFIKRHDRGLILYRPPRTEEGIARERELLAGHLALEVRRWVCELEQSDANCQSVIERAGLLLDQSPLNMRGEYVFDADRAAEEVLRIWKPEACDAGDLEFTSLFGRCLAAWIRFWIAQPLIWNRALDLEFAYFGSKPNAPGPYTPASQSGSTRAVPKGLEQVSRHTGEE